MSRLEGVRQGVSPTRVATVRDDGGRLRRSNLLQSAHDRHRSSTARSIGPVGGSRSTCGARFRARSRSSRPIQRRCGASLRPADVLLVAGSSKLSTAIKYLTQSTWSHAALYVGEGLAPRAEGEPRVLIEVTPVDGCAAVPLSKYERFHTRICRPVGLTNADQEALLEFMVSRLGTQYDMRNIFDLARYLLPTPPVPARWRRRMIALGSGEPTRTICSSLIAEAFGRVQYPILPSVERADGRGARHQLVPPPRDPAHPPLQPVRAGGLRPVALLPDRQADPGAGLQLQGPDVGAGRARGAAGGDRPEGLAPASPSLHSLAEWREGTPLLPGGNARRSQRPPEPDARAQQADGEA